MKCGKPCRYLLCDGCYEQLPRTEMSLLELEPSLRGSCAEFVPEVGLPVSVDGVARLS